MRGKEGTDYYDISRACKSPDDIHYEGMCRESSASQYNPPKPGDLWEVGLLSPNDDCD